MIIAKRHSNMWCSSCGNKTDNTEVLFRYTDENGRTSIAGNIKHDNNSYTKVCNF